MIGLCLLFVAAGEPPLVNYVAKGETRSWEPIALAEVERFVEGKVLSGLTQGGSLRLQRSNFSELAKADYKLIINGRFIEEAERFSVYLTFGAGQKSEVPSFFVVETSAPLGKQPRGEVQKRIEAAAAQAALRLSKLVTPHLERLRLNLEPPSMDEPLPLAWGPVEVPTVTDRRKALQTLLDVRNEDNERLTALAEIRGYAFDQQAVRNALERCVLFDPTARLRAECVDALAPVYRNHVPTQRVLLHALRTDVDDQVLKALVESSATFVGFSRLETIATWLELLTRERTPERAAESVADRLREEKDVPNLLYALSACLKLEAIPSGKKQACTGRLLDLVPREQRIALLKPYLLQQPVYGTGQRMAFEDALKSLTRNQRTADPLAGELLLQVAERKSAHGLRYLAVYEAADHADPTPANLERLLALAREESLADQSLRALVDVVERNPALIAMAIGALDRLEAQKPWYPKPSRGNPYKELAQARDRLRRLEKKQAP